MTRIRILILLIEYLGSIFEGFNIFTGSNIQNTFAEILAYFFDMVAT